MGAVYLSWYERTFRAQNIVSLMPFSILVSFVIFQSRGVFIPKAHILHKRKTTKHSVTGTPM